jgi:tRNA threonylcarbamoyladenosine biosynthesis protein TsaE
VPQPALTLRLPDEYATRSVGALLATSIPQESRELLLTLSGELGTGKTTLARGLLQACGVDAAVRSPTYTLVEPYESGRGRLLHLDLYRLQGAQELEDLAYRDLRRGSLLTLVEWPEKAAAGLGPVDLAAELAYLASGRELRLVAGTANGRSWLGQFVRTQHELPDSTSARE